MRNTFLTALRHVSDGTRLYGRDQQGQEVAILAVAIYLPLVLPLLMLGVWTDFDSWIQSVHVPTPGLLLASYAVVVAIVIALALTPPGNTSMTAIAPYPIERPVKLRIIHNCRLLLVAMLGLGAVGVLFSSGVDRLEHAVCLAIGALLLQLGHLDELNAVQTDSVLGLLGTEPLATYENWYRQQWGEERSWAPVRSHRLLARRRLTATLVLLVIHLVALVGFIVSVHGPSGLLHHGVVILFLSATAALLTVRCVESVLNAILAERHCRHSRNGTWFGHPETYFALVLALSKLTATAAMVVLPLMWMDARTMAASLSYLVFLAAESAGFLLLLRLLAVRWLSTKAALPPGLGTYDREYMAFALKKRATRERAAIRGAQRYKQRLQQRTGDH